MSNQLMKLGVVGASAFTVLLLLVYAPSLYSFFGSFIVVAGAVWYAEREGGNDRIPFWNHGVLITGCDMGFGHELAHHLANSGVMVFAGCLDSKGKGAEALKEALGQKVHVLQMDVTKDEEVAAAVEYVKENKPRRGLWGIVNNAGLNFNGDIELTTMEQYNKILQINLLGTIRVTKAFLPFLKRSEGRVVNVSSVKGRFTAPFLSAYGCSKHGMEAFSDILRLEMAHWGVKVAIIEPGNYGGATGALDMERMKSDFEAMWSGMDEELKKDYGREYIDTHLTRITKAAPTANFNINPVIDAMTGALFDYKPKIRYVVAGSNKGYDIYTWLITLTHLLPTSLMDRVTLWIVKPHTPHRLLNN